MPTKPPVIVDPHFRRMAEIFSASDLARLQLLAEVIWGKDDPMPSNAFHAVLPDAEVIVCADWRYGDDALSSAAKLRAGDEAWLHAGNTNTFTLYGKAVGFIGYGNLARALRTLISLGG